MQAGASSLPDSFESKRLQLSSRFSEGGAVSLYKKKFQRRNSKFQKMDLGFEFF
jgi:hypothetical protein